MRIPLALALLLLAGCAGDTNSPPHSQVPVVEAVPLASLPSSQYVNETMPPSTTDTLQVGLNEPCTSQLETCHLYPFELPRNATLTVFLEWAPGANDLDLYLFQDGQVEFEEAATANSRGEFMRLALEAGAYEVRVAGYLSSASYEGTAGTPYSLQMHFDEPRAPNP